MKFKNKVISIMARDINGGIGFQNALPWGHIPQDMKHFINTTKGKIVIMGRKTFESIGSKPLPHRINVVLSNDIDFLDSITSKFVTKVYPCCHISDVIGIANQYEKDVCIIGGASIYKLFEPHIDEVIETVILGSFNCDTYVKLVDPSVFHQPYSPQFIRDDETDIELIIQRWVKNQ